MILKYLGTAAAEGIPALYCECDTCKKARAEQQFRTRSQAIIDEKLLIDFGPDTYYHSLKYNIDFSKVRNIGSTPKVVEMVY